MSLSLTTPALLFPAISLLLLAYTNRFLTLANLIRSLHTRYLQDPSPTIWGQIKNLKKRVNLIKLMQLYGIGSLLLCVLDMFLLFQGWLTLGMIIFSISLILLMISLLYSIREIFISVEALNIVLKTMEKPTST